MPHSNPATGKSSAAAREKIIALRARYLSQLPERMETANALYQSLCKNAGDMAALSELHRLLHGIKGTASTFGFIELGQLAGQGEELLGGQLKPSDDPLPEAILTALGGALSQLRHAADVVITLTDKAGADDAFLLDIGLNFSRPDQQAGRLVYVCDDESLFAEQLCAQLAVFGYEAIGFTEPARLHEAVLARRPDALIMDINFPEGNDTGLTTFANLNTLLEPHLPGVFLSARRDFAARLGAVRAGADDYFVKPTRPSELVAVLDRLTFHEETQPLRVLVIDDEPEMASYHAIILQRAGMSTYELNNPDWVLDVLAEFRPDLVLMDMYMPGCHGREVAKVIRQIPEYVGLPIVYLSSETDAKKQQQAMSVGTEGFLSKPVAPEELVNFVSIRAERMRTLRSLMSRDSLTSLFNHTTTTKLLDWAISQARRNGKQLSLVMLDLDKFKSVNDTHGHPAGDQVIVGLARLLQQRLRSSDIIGRYGGEEFLIILPEVSLQEATLLIDRLRQDFSRISFYSGDTEFHCTFSAGIAAFPQRDRQESLLDAADRALYAAKHAGRNQIVMDEPSEKE